MFTDEKMFSVHEKFNKQNDRVYVHVSKEATESGKSTSSSLHDGLVGVSYEGVTQLHFCKQRIKTRAVNYQTDILETVVNPLINNLFIYLFIIKY